MSSISQLLNEAFQHHRSNRLSDAERLYHQILLADPTQSDALNLLAAAICQRGDYQAALPFAERAVQVAPRQATFHNTLGTVLSGLDRMDESAAAFRQAIEVDPTLADAWTNLGNVLRKQGQTDEAIECLQQSLQLDPRRADTHTKLAHALRDGRQPARAVSCFNSALEIKSNHLPALIGLAVALGENGALDEALTVCRRAIDLDPQNAAVSNTLGNIYKSQGKLDQAVAVYRRILQSDPDNGQVLSNLGHALLQQNVIEEARSCMQRALDLNPRSASALHNMGALLVSIGRFDEAIANFDEALRIAPDYADARLSRGMARLLTGDRQLGLEDYEARLEQRELNQRLWIDRPKWSGDSLSGKKLLLRAEQGLGDTVHFVRYAATARRRGATTIVQCQPSLISLLGSCAGIDTLVPQGSALPDIDVYAPLLSMPLLCGDQADADAAPAAYLCADPQLVTQWRGKLGEDGIKIGICWRGNSKHRKDWARSTAVECFAPLATLAGVRLISLDQTASVDDLPDWMETLPGDEFDTVNGAFMDTAAVMMNLELVITVDTAIAHVAGALGVPVWIALGFVPDWRWSLERTDADIYPSARLFRQPSHGDWQNVFMQIKAALQDRLARAA